MKNKSCKVPFGPEKVEEEFRRENRRLISVLKKFYRVEREPELSATAVPAVENGPKKSSELAGWAVVDDGGDDGLL